MTQGEKGAFEKKAKWEAVQDPDRNKEIVHRQNRTILIKKIITLTLQKIDKIEKN